MIRVTEDVTEKKNSERFVRNSNVWKAVKYFDLNLKNFGRMIQMFGKDVDIQELSKGKEVIIRHEHSAKKLNM